MNYYSNGIGNSEGRKTNIMKKTMWKFLLVGTEGSGKTTLLDDIALKARSKGIQVLRPALPLDVLGTTIGAAEDALISMVSYAITKSHSRRILLLDDIDTILGGKVNGGVETNATNDGRSCNFHTYARLNTVLWSLLDAVGNRSEGKEGDDEEMSSSQLILICSSSGENFGNSSTGGRFDKVFHFATPADKERENIISGCLGDLDDTEDTATKKLLPTIVDCTSGLSRAVFGRDNGQAVSHIVRVFPGAHLTYWYLC
jgi:SpoVK/Ycf46/Vps4 family AAA+-type ATPase